jgi:hypothetical protein
MCLLHTVEVTGSNPVSPTIYLFNIDTTEVSVLFLSPYFGKIGAFLSHNPSHISNSVDFYFL